MFKYKGNLSAIKDAVIKAHNKEVQVDLSIAIRKEQFDMSTASSIYLANNLIEFIEFNDINVKIYYKRFSRAVAYFTPSRPRDININGSKLSRTQGSIVATLYHEAAHMFDDWDTVHSFGHGDNSSIGKQNTFPYKVGNLVHGIVDESLIDMNGEYSNIEYKRSAWNIVRRFFRRWF